MKIVDLSKFKEKQIVSDKIRTIKSKQELTDIDRKIMAIESELATLHRLMNDLRKLYVKYRSDK